MAELDIHLAAWKLKIKGWSNDDIASELGVTRQTVGVWIKNKLAEMAEEETQTAEEYRQQEVARLDAIIRSQMGLMEQEGPRSADSANAATRAIELKAKILGLQAPVEMSVIQANLTFADMLRYTKQRQGIADSAPETIDSTIVSVIESPGDED